MLSIESLRAFGANVDEGVGRCMGNGAVYLRMVGMAIRDASFDQLKEAVEAGDLNRGFECAHALKGVMGNVALEPIYQPICKITELLRARTDTDYSELLAGIMTERDKLISLL